MTRVNLHCHSMFSDGELTPETLAENLSGAGVRYAALTDHDSVEGLPRFQEALRRRNIGFLTGVEITVQCEGREAHLLGYGFDPTHPDLQATLVSLRQVQGLEVHSIAGSLRKVGTTTDEASASAAPNGQLDILEAIALLHRAGGKAFLAHPLMFEDNFEALEKLLVQLKAHGLDGAETWYEPFSEEQRNRLAEIANRLELLTSAGTDVHMTSGSAKSGLAMEMPAAAWKTFRQAVSGGAISPESASQTAIKAHPAAGARPPIYRRRYFILRIFIPTLLAIGLFVAALWGLILPSFEQSLLDRKREMIRELTNSAWSILASYERDERAGLLTREEAQALAISRIEALRYGRESKDYFWLQDLTPRIIMHPYRPDLNGQDVSGFTDPRGAQIFVEFADLVRRKDEGYIEYVWQWKDDPERLEPKESYVKGFAPWGWVIGTGIYIEDVQQEIARLEQNLINTSLGIGGVVVALLLFVAYQSLTVERQRREAESGLHESTERYRSLVEAATEGTLLVLDGRCRYANPTLLEMLGYSPAQLELLDLADVLPRDESNAAAWAAIEHPTGERGFDGVLQQADGQLVECALALSPMSSAGISGFILLAKPVATSFSEDSAESERLWRLAQVAQSAPLGLFRAKAARRGIFTELNRSAHALLETLPSGEAAQPALADLFQDSAEYEAFFQQLQKDNAVSERLLHLQTRAGGVCILALTARLVRDEHGSPDWLEGVLKDVTSDQKQAAEREAQIEKLQTSLLFLHEPLQNLGRHLVACDLETPLQQVAAKISAQNTSAALITGAGGVALGIITDQDLRTRLLAENLPPQTPARAIMSAPLVKISENALIYEALMRMEEKAIQHLAVQDENGQIVSLIRGKDLVQFQRYGLTVLGREIARAASVDELVRCCERTPSLVRVLVESGARTRSITRMLSTICDAATERLVELASAELGPAPVEFVFLALGSQGRQEQTLLTDQDNAILFAPPPDAETQSAAEEYFLRLGTFVCNGLNRAGYAWCRGEVMAKNPRWVSSLDEWKEDFSAWIQTAEPQELLEFSIFFDFRAVYGKAELADELRQHIHAELDEQPAFFPHLAQNALAFKPPLRLPGKIYLSGTANEPAGQINLKDALMPIVSFARLYALRHKVPQTHTLNRLDGLVEKNALNASTRDEMAVTYDLLMRLRLKRQIAAIQNGELPDNLIHPGKLDHMEETLLQQAFSQISAVQKKISYDFLGGG